MSGVEQAEFLSIWILLTLFFGLLLSRKNYLLAKAFLLAAAARIVVAVLQSGYGVFLKNQDAAHYASLGTLIGSGDVKSYGLGDVSPNQLGIIATNAWVSTFAGPVPAIVMSSILASIASSVAVVFVLAPFMGGFGGKWIVVGGASERRLLMYGAALLPSFVFWGSQALKEPFLMLGLAMFVFAFYVGWPAKAIFASLGALICIAYRPYIGALVLGVGALFALARPARRRAPRATLAVLLFVALVVGIAYGSNVTGVGLSEQAQNSELAGGGSVIDSGAGNVGGFSNVAEFFFAPVPWQFPSGVQGVFAYIESMIIGLLIIRYLLLLLTGRRELVSDGSLVAMLLFCTGASIYAAALANSGTLARERSPFLLVLLPLLILSIGRRKRITDGVEACGLDPEVPGQCRRSWPGRVGAERVPQ